MQQNLTLLTIDLGALSQNYRTLVKVARAPVAGVIKANGYGFGIAEVAKALVQTGASEFFVASIDEGLTLRAAIGAEATIFVIGPILQGSADVLRHENLIPILNCLEDVAYWRANGQNHPCAIHFDTGMNRLGLRIEESARMIDNPSLIEGINLVLGMSHFASSDALNDPLNDLQIMRFKTITRGLPIKRWSLCNTSAIYQFPDEHYNLVRAGYGLYGGNPLPHTTNPMQSVVTLEARILQTKQSKSGESVGYNATYTLKNDSLLAVIGLGYADGFLRTLSSKGFVYWRGQPCPIVGRVSMDLTTIDITHIKGEKPKTGDMVEVIGPNQNIDAIAALAGTNGYEIITRLGERYKRRYIDAL